MTPEQIDTRILQLQERAKELKEEIKEIEKSQSQLFQEIEKNHAIVEAKENQIIAINKKLKNS